MNVGTLAVMVHNSHIDGALRHRAQAFPRMPPLVTIGVKDYGPDYRLEVASYDVFQVQILLDGALDLAIPGQRVRLTPGDGVVYRLGSAYTVSAAGAPARVLHCTFRGDVRVAFQGSASWFHGDATVQSLVTLIRAHAVADAPANSWLLAALAEALAAQAERLAPGRRHSDAHADYAAVLVERACNLLKATAHSGEHPQRLLASIGLSYRHVGRLFREHVGMSPKQYQVDARLELARQLLDDPSLTIRDVAEQLQFSSPQHFSREFSKHCGQSPRAYRRAHGAGGGGTS